MNFKLFPGCLLTFVTQRITRSENRSPRGPGRGRSQHRSDGWGHLQCLGSGGVDLLLVSLSEAECILWLLFIYLEFWGFSLWENISKHEAYSPTVCCLHHLGHLDSSMERGIVLQPLAGFLYFIKSN